jgi:hypothetical protein
VPAGPVVPIDQLGFQGAEERFGHSVIKAVTDRSGGGGNAGIGEALGGPQRGVLGTLVALWWISRFRTTSRRHSPISKASWTRSVVIRSAICQPTTLQENTSSTTAKYKIPCRVLI